MKIHISGIFILALLVPMLLLSSCVKETEPDYREKDYGYVQFKLYKAASYPESKADIEYLNDVTKIKVMLRYGNSNIAQTLVLSSSGSDAAEFGLRSDKLKLLAGDYSIIKFTLYDKLDEEVYNGGAMEGNTSFTVVPGGLVVHDLTADVISRGKVRFSLVKNMSAFTGELDVKSGDDRKRKYTFDEIGYVSVSIRTGKTTTTHEMLPAEFSVHFTEDDVPDDQTSTILCDTLVNVKAGEYTVTAYSVYDSSKKLLETCDDVKDAKEGRNEVTFIVEDNEVTDVDVPVWLYESDEYLKDYYALYEIWKALGGDDWYYRGEDYAEGANWDFNKDPDLWGSQPGVSLHSNGRVAMINLSGFGFYGHMPESIGQLTALVELYLGSHNDNNQSAYDPVVQEGKGTANRMARHKEYLGMRYPATQMSEPIARALAEHNVVIPETALYQTMNESDIIDHQTGRMKIQPKDMISGKVCNGLRSLPKQIGNLVNLEQLFIANSEIESLPAEMANLYSCTDLELYNCPNMTEFPLVLAEMPSLVSLNIANNKQWNADEALKGLKALATGKSNLKLQILYMNENNLEVIPAEFTNMEKLGLIDFASNKIHTIEEPWGNSIKPVQLYLDDNKLSSFPTENGVFCYMEDAETFSVKNNLFTEFPDIFDSGSMYAIVSIDFSYNRISGFQNGEKFKGVNVETLTIANNPQLTKYPVELKTSNSKVGNINFRGCNISEFPDSCFCYDNSILLSSFDLSYNDLTDLPSDMHAGNLPYLYGVELSYNRFSEFPYEPLDSQYLTVYSIRGQRNEAGERCLSEWPTGIYQHRGLRGFYIGSNNLGKIEDTISTICYYLDISDNPEIIFDASDICYAYQAGAYILIYDKTQDVRNCDYLLN